MSDDEKSLAKREMGLSIPMIPIAELSDLTNYVAQIKGTLMTEGKDYIIQKGKQYTARSGFAKLSQGFNLSDEILKEEEMYKDGTFFGYNYTIRVFNSLGRQATGVGSCTIDEPNLIHHKERPYHDVRSIAFTRAWNRAVSNFVGSADVSAEEMSLGPEFDRKKVDSKQVPPAQSEGPVQITSVSGMEAYLRDNDCDPGLVEIVDEGEVLVMTSIEYLEDDWVPINLLVRRAGGSWVQVEGKKNYWRIPKAESPEGEQVQKPPEEQPQESEEEGEMTPFNPFAKTMKVVKSIQEIEYILDGKFPGAQELFTVTEDVKTFTVEPKKVLDEELAQEATMLLRRLGGEYREVPGSIGYLWIIQKKE